MPLYILLFWDMHGFCRNWGMKSLTRIGATLLLGAAMMTGCKDVKDPEFRRVENFGLKNLSLQEATVGFSVTYFNPNDFGVNVKETEADIYLDTVYMGRFTQDANVNVDKNAEFSIPLSGKIPLQKARDLDLQNIGNREILLRAEGATRVGKAGVYVKKDIRYEGRHRLSDIQLK